MYLHLLITSLTWTFIHSLWQATFLAAFAGLTIQLTKKSTTILRYNILVILMCFFITVVGYTFCVQILSTETSEVSFTHTTVGDLANTNPLGGEKHTGFVTFSYMNHFVTLTNFISLYIDAVFSFWLFFFFIKLALLLRNVYSIYELRTKQLTDLSPQWHEIFNKLKQKLCITKQVGFYESNLISIPSAIGTIKPLILLPIGIVNKLPQDQIEAILLHELAHIKRNDFAVNLIQKIVEMFFFFNPALIWVSSLISQEREHCCDDMAVKIHHDKKSFVQALCQFQDIVDPRPQSFILNFGNQKMPFLQRATRILLNQNTSLMNLDKSFFGACLLFTSFACFHLFANTKNHIQTPVVKTLGFAKEGKVIYSNFDKFKILDSIPPDSLRINMVKFLQDSLKMEEESKKMEAESRKMEAESHKMEEESRKMEAESRKMEEESHKMEEESRKMEAESRKMEEESRKMEAESRKMEAESRKMEAESRKMEEESHKMEAESLKMETESRKIEEESRKMEAESLRMEEENKNIIKDLLSDRLINTTNNLSFSIKKNELIVNGKKQNADLTNKYYKKYGINGGIRVYNSRNN